MRQVKQIPKMAPTKRSWWRLGPGAILSLIVGAGIVYWQISRSPDTNMGRITYEADASGHLHQVASPARKNGPQTAPPPFWKPEVHLLVEREQELHLTPRQRAALRKLDIAWIQEKSDWQRRFGESTGAADALLQRADPKHGALLTIVRSGLEDYSRLSEEYDRRRTGVWMQAIRLLTTLQRRQLDRTRLEVKRSEVKRSDVKRPEVSTKG